MALRIGTVPVMLGRGVQHRGPVARAAILRLSPHLRQV
jgi:hypothetical protein